jgi:hypothetical protein
MSYIIEQAKHSRLMTEKAVQSLADADALTVVNLYPHWKTLVSVGKTVEKGFRFQYGNKLYRTEQAEYTFVAHYVPGEGTESLFSKVNESHAGTVEDPIPFETNMEIYEGLYYTQNGVLYRCIRSSGQPLYHDLALLVGSYVEAL